METPKWLSSIPHKLLCGKRNRYNCSNFTDKAKMWRKTTGNIHPNLTQNQVSWLSICCSFYWAMLLPNNIIRSEVSLTWCEGHSLLQWDKCLQKAAPAAEDEPAIRSRRFCEERNSVWSPETKVPACRRGKFGSFLTQQGSSYIVHSLLQRIKLNNLFTVLASEIKVHILVVFQKDFSCPNKRKSWKPPHLLIPFLNMHIMSGATGDIL